MSETTPEQTSGEPVTDAAADVNADGGTGTEPTPDGSTELPASDVPGDPDPATDVPSTDVPADDPGEFYAGDDNGDDPELDETARPGTDDTGPAPGPDPATSPLTPEQVAEAEADDTGDTATDSEPPSE